MSVRRRAGQNNEPPPAIQTAQIYTPGNPSRKGGQPQRPKTAAAHFEYGNILHNQHAGGRLRLQSAALRAYNGSRAPPDAAPPQCLRAGQCVRGSNNYPSASFAKNTLGSGK
jgi:hypothetical protein